MFLPSLFVPQVSAKINAKVQKDPQRILKVKLVKLCCDVLTHCASP